MILLGSKHDPNINREAVVELAVALIVCGDNISGLAV
jgi:hypothetical protein